MPSERDIFLGDIIVCIAEDFGYNGWRQVVSYHWTDEDPRGNTVKIVDIEDEDQPEFYVTDAEIIKGINLIIDGKIAIREDYVKTIRQANKENDAGDIDVELADIILQAAIFESYIYG